MNYQTHTAQEIEARLEELGAYDIWNSDEHNAKIAELEYQLGLAKRAAEFGMMRQAFGDEAIKQAFGI